MGDKGAGNRGDRRPRVVCSLCGRSIAVTFDHRTGDAVIRSHVVRPGERCMGSRMLADRGTLE